MIWLSGGRYALRDRSALSRSSATESGHQKASLRTYHFQPNVPHERNTRKLRTRKDAHRQFTTGDGWRRASRHLLGQHAGDLLIDIQPFKFIDNYSALNVCLVPVAPMGPAE